MEWSRKASSKICQPQREEGSQREREEKITQSKELTEKEFLRFPRSFGTVISLCVRNT